MRTDTEVREVETPYKYIHDKEAGPSGSRAIMPDNNFNIFPKYIQNGSVF